MSKEYIYAGGRLVATEEPGSLAAPSGLRILNNRASVPFKGRLSWGDNSTGETGFKIEKKADGSSAWVQLSTVGPEVTSFLVGGACGDAYRVRATGATGETAPTNEVYACMATGGSAPAGLVAHAGSAAAVDVNWSAPATGTVEHYEIERVGADGQFVLLSASQQATTFTDQTAQPGNAYVYQVRAVFDGGTYSPYSNPDMATTLAFTDDPLTAQFTPIKALHITELRQAVNAARATAGLGAVAWTDESLGGVRVKAAHLQELRVGLDAALSALGLSVAPYTDASLPGVAIKKAHIEELRQRTR